MAHLLQGKNSLFRLGQKKKKKVLKGQVKLVIYVQSTARLVLFNYHYNVNMHNMNERMSIA